MAIVISGVNNNDKITASDGTIDLLSGVSFASTITAPGFTASNNITAASINIGDNIQIGNAGIVTATTFLGNLTGNVNHTSNLLLQISGSEKLRIANSGAFGLNGTNYGTSGQVLTSQGSGSSPTWTTIPTEVTISNNSDNRIITGGSGVNLNGEANLNFDGTGLVLAGHIDIRTGSSINTNVTGGTTSGTLHKNTTNGEFAIVSGGTGGNNYLTFYTSASAAPTEKLRIAHNGEIGIGGANYGTSGQFLQSQGSGSAVQWATVSSDFVKISSTTMGGEAAQFELDFDTTTYKYFKIYLTGLNLSFDANLYVRFKVGGTIQTNNAYYGGTIKKHAGGFDNSTYGGQHQNYGYLTDNVGGNDATYERYSAIFDINCGEASRGMPFLRHDSFYKDNAGNHANTMGIVGYQNWNQINGIRFYASSGNINHGKFDLYGIK